MKDQSMLNQNHSSGVVNQSGTSKYANEPMAEEMEDQSMLNQSSGTANHVSINEYANELIKEVCLKEESLSKYQKQIEKKMGADFYKKCDNFVTAVKESVKKKKFSNASILNLQYLAQEINIPIETVEIVTKHYTKKFNQEKKEKEEEEAALRKREEEERQRQEEAWRRKREEEERERKWERNKKIALFVAKWGGLAAAAGVTIWLLVTYWQYILVIFIIICIIVGIFKKD